MIRLRPSGADDVLIKRITEWYDPGPGAFISNPTTVFSPLSLFANNEVGGWYDPSDFNRYMAPLGPELVTNGTFDTDTTGWTTENCTQAVVGGELELTATSAGFWASLQTITTVVGKTYLLSVNCYRKQASGNVRMTIAGLVDGAAITATTPTTTTIVFRATATSHIVRASGYGAAVGDKFSYDNISVRELTAIDTATLFQDSAGTTPVTAVEQPVGLMLDKSKGLVLGSDIAPAFTSALWGGGDAGTTLVGNVINFSSDPLARVYCSTSGSPSGYYEFKVTFSSSDAGKKVRLAYWATGVDGITSTNSAAFDATIPANGVVSRRFFGVAITNLAIRNGSDNTARSVTVQSLTCLQVLGNHAFQSTSAARPVLSARVNLLNATATLSTQSVTTVATNYTLYFTGTGSITLSGTATGTYTAGSNTITCTAGTLTLTVSGSVLTADLRPVNDGVGLPVYQAVTNSTTYETTGFPLYIKPNGSSQWMQTNSINFSSTDKMTVFAGVRKLNDTSGGVVIETSTGTSQGRTYIYAGSKSTATGARWTFGSFGTLPGDAETVASFAAPLTNVLTGIGDISGDIAILRVNGIQAASSTADQGTGNFGNYPLYLFARAGTSLWFGGRLYGLIVRGAATTAAQISSTETWMNGKTRAY